MRRMFLALLWSSVVVAQAVGVLAQPPRSQAAPEALEPENPEYKQAVDAGIEEYGLGHYEEARSLFERAHAIDPNARTLRGLGMVEFELRHYVRAAQLLEASLATERKPLTTDQRDAVQELLARTWRFIARFTVEVQPESPAAQFELDGQPIELDAERRLTLEAGEHVLRVTAPDRQARQLRIDAKGGEQRVLQVELSAPLEPAPVAKATLPTKEPRERPVLGIVLTSVGSAVAAAGASLGVAALLAAKDAEVRESTEADRAHKLALAADVALGVGLATAVTGAVLLLVKRRSRQEEQRSSLRPGFAGFGVRF